MDASLSGLVKPNQWPVHRAAVSPRWDWFHRSAKSIIPFWQGNESPRSILNPNVAPTTTGSPTWAWGHVGWATQHASGSINTRQWPAASLPEWNMGTESFTVLAVFRDDLTAGATVSRWIVGKQDAAGSPFEGWSIYRIGGGGGLFHMVFSLVDDAATFRDITMPAHPKETPIACVLSVDKEAQVYRGYWHSLIQNASYGTSGEASSSGALGNTSATDQDLRIGNFTPTGASANNFFGQFYFLCLLDRAITRQQAMQWMDNPFGPITMFDDVAGIVSAAAQTITGSLNSAIQQQLAISASLGGAVQDVFSRTVSLDAALAALMTATADLDAALAAVLSTDANLSGALQQAITAQASLNAAVEAFTSGTADLSGALSASATSSASIDGVIAAANAATVSLNAALAKAFTVTASLNASLTEVGQSTLATDLNAALLVINSAIVSLSGALQVAKSISASLSAALANGLVSTADISGALANSLQALANLNSAVLAGQTLTSSLNARLSLAAGAACPPYGTRTFTVAGGGRTFVVPSPTRRH